jgi:hypothetical protein
MHPDFKRHSMRKPGMSASTTKSKNTDSSRHGSQKGMPAKRTRLHGRFLLGGLAVLGGVVLFNALALQKERHPSPLFQPIVAVAQPPLPPPLPPRKEQSARTAPATSASVASLSAPAPSAPPAPPAALSPAIEKAALTERILGAEKAKPVAPITPPADGADAALLSDLQRELAKRGHYKGEIDGKSGPMMVQAIRSFQFSQRVAVDGKASDALLREVRATKITPVKDELLDLLRKTTPENNKANADKSGRALTNNARTSDKLG